MHYSHLIQAEVDQCLTSVHSAQFLGVWLNLLGKFPESISGTNEEEKPRVGLLCAGMVHQILSKIVDKIGTLINSIASSFQRMSQQLLPSAAAAMVTAEQIEGQVRYTVQAESPAGSESIARNRAQLQEYVRFPSRHLLLTLFSLPAHQDMLARLCHILSGMEVLYVYTSVYSPLVVCLLLASFIGDPANGCGLVLA
jgi:hypothetical protein